MKNDARIIYYMIFTLVLVLGLTISASFLLADAWEQPTGDTPSGGFMRPIQNVCDVDNYCTTSQVSVSDDFMVDTDGEVLSDFFVDVSNRRVGIGTAAPVVSLDVRGPIQLGSFSIMPACTTLILGSFAFYQNNNMPYVCTGSGWQMLQADIDSDGKW